MVKIEKAGSYIPQQIITNKNLVKQFSTDFDLEKWIVEKTGILERRKSDLKPSDQGVIATRNAIENLDHDVDFIIVNTFFGDYTMPQTATLIQQKLKLEKSFAFELNMPCAGPIYTMAIAKLFLDSGKYNTGLIIGVDKMLDVIDPEDYLMNSIFGEGAGAVLLKKNANSNSGIVDFYLGSSLENKEDENYALRVLGGKAAQPLNSFHPNSKKQYLQMEAREVKQFIIEKLKESVKWISSNHLTSIKEIDYVITHQANKVLIEKCLVDEGIPKEKILTTVEYLGNTGSASILITIAEHLTQIKQKNKHILICGMGGGMTWGAIYYKS